MAGWLARPVCDDAPTPTTFLEKEKAYSQSVYVTALDTCECERTGMNVCGADSPPVPTMDDALKALAKADPRATHLDKAVETLRKSDVHVLETSERLRAGIARFIKAGIDLEQEL